MTHQAETVEQAAAQAARRWRTVAVGLALVGVTNLANAAMNAAQLGASPPVVCMAVISDPQLAEQATDQRLDQQRGRLTIPKR